MKKTIAFITTGLEFNGNSLSEKALGGSESAMIYMARELQKLGNTVLVFCKCDSPGIYDGVMYYHYDMFMEDERAQYDVLIVSRYSEFLFSRPIDSKMNILWCHDISTPKFNESLALVDSVFLMSDYQKNVYVEQYNIQDESIIWNTTNGFNNLLINETLDFDSRKNNYIYASRPERGLFKLLNEIWPKILDMNPDATLHLCGYNSFAPDEELSEYYKICNDLESFSKNIINHKELKKPEFYKLLQECAFMIYPTDFCEISCINAIEAQANGCLVITTDSFALIETVKTNTKIKISEDYNEDFLKMVQLYQDRNLWEITTNYAKSQIQSYDWSNIAKEWNAKINAMFINRSTKYHDHIVKQLVYNSDIVQASKVDSNYKSLIQKANIDNVTVSTYISMDHEFAAFSDRGQKLLVLVQDLITKNPNRKLRIADIGSNDGILSLPILKEFKDNIEILYAVDSSIQILEFLKERWVPIYPELTPVNGNVTNIDTMGISDIDLVICGEILEHLENTTEFLSRLMMIGNKDTTFFFTVPKGPWESIIKDADEIHHIHHFEYDDIKQIFGDDTFITKTNNRVLGRRNEECSNYTFWFTGNNRTFNEINYETKLIKTRPYKSISVCMIVKNEEDNLSRCLKTVKNIADEIIIVDTGSTDDTKQIARKFTNKIFDLKWEEEDGLGNFARARNESIKYATSDYVFWIDADEQLECSNRLFLFLQSDYYDSILVKQKHVLPRDRHMIDINNDPYPDRLFKNDGNLHFEGIIHEYVTTSNDWIKKCLFQDEFWILHYGNANLNVLKSKSLDRNSKLIEKNARLYPENLMAKHYQIVDCWSKFVSSQDFNLIVQALNIWNTYFVHNVDKFAQRESFNIIQRFYSFLYQNKLDDDLILFKFSNDIEEIEFLAYKYESDLFLKIKTGSL